MRRIAFCLIAALLLLTATVVMAQKGSDPISQGDFAALLASHLNTPVPAGGWNGTNAPAFLSSIGLTPVSGAWTPAATLTEGDLVHILRLMGMSYYTTEPNNPVTWAHANAVLLRFGDFFRKYNLVARAVDGSTTTHIYTGIGATSAGAPASPSTP
jgi:hypothetical protein